DPFGASPEAPPSATKVTRATQMDVRRDVAALLSGNMRPGRGREVVDVVRRMGDLLEITPENMVLHEQGHLVDEIGRGLEDAWRDANRSRTDLSPCLKEALDDPDGPYAIRIGVFNSMCTQGLFGLTSRNRFDGSDPSGFTQHLENTLDPKDRALFESVCNSYDNVNMLILMGRTGEELAELESRRDSSDVKQFAGERSAIFKGMVQRLRNEGFTADSVKMGESGRLGRILNGGFDVALTLLGFHGIKVGKAALEAVTAVKCDDLLGWLKDHALSLGKRGGIGTMQGLWSKLPNGLKDALPKKMGRWIEKDRPVDIIPKRFLTSRFTDTSFKARFKHFLTGSIPFVPAGASLPGAKWMAKKLEGKGHRRTAGVVRFFGSPSMGKDAAAKTQAAAEKIKALYSQTATQVVAERHRAAA
ncbi:MAG: hypothetical protein UY05_C0001G0013, partial [Candidatus Peregrinibacteria bacterium GW2011_GWA2_47_7]